MEATDRAGPLLAFTWCVMFWLVLAVAVIELT